MKTQYIERLCKKHGGTLKQISVTQWKIEIGWWAIRFTYHPEQFGPYDIHSTEGEERCRYHPNLVSAFRRCLYRQCFATVHAGYGGDLKVALYLRHEGAHLRPEATICINQASPGWWLRGQKAQKMGIEAVRTGEVGPLIDYLQEADIETFLTTIDARNKR